MSELRTNAKVLRSQDGLVSMAVTMILMIVLSLIVLGFAQVARRNQRQALDQQLSTQAFYAAESGINEVRNLIKDAGGTGAAIPAKTTCPSGGGGGFYNTLNSNIDTTGGVSYTCLLVDPSPPSLSYDNIYDPSTIIPIFSNTGENITRVTLTWKSSTPNPLAGCPIDTNSRFTPTASWTCGYGVLRFDLVPIPGGTFNIGSLSSTVMTTFAVPNSGAGVNAMTFTPGDDQDVKGIRCTNTDCRVTITFTGANISDQYYMRIKSIYKPVSLQVVANNAAGGTLELKSAQIMIDATGKARDVLRRVQVRLPVVDSRNRLPDYAMQSNSSICKRFAAMDGYYQQTGLPVSGGPMCSNVP